jgi:hypothetical protein
MEFTLGYVMRGFLGNGAKAMVMTLGCSALETKAMHINAHKRNELGVVLYHKKSLDNEGYRHSPY